MKNSVILALLAATLVFCGCDMFRNVAGRPTSKEIARMRVEVANAEKEALKARQKALEDSLALLDSQRQAQVNLEHLDVITELYSENPSPMYYAIIGSFREQENLESMIRKIAAEGYIPAVFHFGGGMTGVGISLGRPYEEAIVSYMSIRREAFCPSDAWILYNK